MPRKPKLRRYFRTVGLGAVLVKEQAPEEIWGVVDAPMTALLVRSPDAPVKWCAKLPLDAELTCTNCGGVPMDGFAVSFTPAFK